MAEPVLTLMTAHAADFPSGTRVKAVVRASVAVHRLGLREGDASDLARLPDPHARRVVLDTVRSGNAGRWSPSGTILW
jgi:hypothetical protein